LYGCSRKMQTAVHCICCSETCSSRSVQLIVQLRFLIPTKAHLKWHSHGVSSPALSISSFSNSLLSSFTAWRHFENLVEFTEISKKNPFPTNQVNYIAESVSAVSLKRHFNCAFFCENTEIDSQVAERVVGKKKM
jgi:hypothetical protein